MTGDERRVAERRTMAMRGPNAAGLTPPQSLAASNPCLNCGTNVQLTYCPECGQREIDSDPSLREFLHELAEEFLRWDGKLLTTYRLLVVRPGELTREYLAGRRVRFISPLRLYLSCSVLFFFLSAVVPEMQVAAQGREVHRGAVQVGRSTPEKLAEPDSPAAHAPMPQRLWFAHFARALRNPEKLAASVQSSIPTTMFVLTPLFAALIGVAYRVRRRRYPQHLAFALHVHAVLFLGLVITLAARLIPDLRATLSFDVLVVIAIALHVVYAAKRVYEMDLVATIGRLAVAGVLYFAAFIAVLYGAFAVEVLAF